MGMDTGVDLEKLVDAGEFICQELKRTTHSKVAKALLAKRTSS
jgi:hydroxymethylglutaryl-CoA lyase